MQEHQLRVVKEKEELDEKRSKLKPFVEGEVFKGLDPQDQLLLQRQLNIMDQYSMILDARITRFA